MTLEEFAAKILGRRITKVEGRPGSYPGEIEIEMLELDDGLIGLTFQGSGQIDVDNVWAHLNEA